MNHVDVKRSRLGEFDLASVSSGTPGAAVGDILAGQLRQAKGMVESTIDPPCNRPDGSIPTLGTLSPMRGDSKRWNRTTSKIAIYLGNSSCVRCVGRLGYG